MYELLSPVYRRVDYLIQLAINRLRVIRLRLLGARVGRDVRVFGRFAVVGNARNLSIGDGTKINEGVLFELRGRIDIGRGVHLSAGTQIFTGKLDLDISRDLHESAPVRIGDHVWIAASTVISPGVTIQSSTVVGANSVVLSGLGCGIFAAGVPARPIRKIISAD